MNERIASAQFPFVLIFSKLPQLSLMGSVIECSYKSMFSSTTLVCIVDLMCIVDRTCIVDLMCIVDHTCLLACNVCGGITAVAFSCCGILHLTLCGSTSGPAWYPSCPVISGKLPSSGLLHYLWFIYVCVGHMSAVFTPSRRCFYSTESIFYFFACLLYTSPSPRDS